MIQFELTEIKIIGGNLFVFSFHSSRELNGWGREFLLSRGVFGFGYFIFWVVEQGEKFLYFFLQKLFQAIYQATGEAQRMRNARWGRETVGQLSTKVICPIRSWMRCLGIDNEKKYSRNLCAAWERDESEKNFQDFTSHLVLLLVGGLWEGEFWHTQCCAQRQEWWGRNETKIITKWKVWGSKRVEKNISLLPLTSNSLSPRALFKSQVSFMSSSA